MKAMDDLDQRFRRVCAAIELLRLSGIRPSLSTVSKVLQASGGGIRKNDVLMYLRRLAWLENVAEGKS